MGKDDLVKIIWDYTHMNQKAEKCDCILGLGSSNLEVPKRCVELYKSGYSDLIVFSGGLGNVTSDIWKEKEADKYAQIAMDMGVPKEHILIENESTNSGENFIFTEKLLNEKGYRIDSFLLVHKPYMERRSYATFMVNIKNKKCIVTSPACTFDDYIKSGQEVAVDEDRLIHIMVGDLQRIKEYPKKGFQIEQEIPEDVWNAYLTLVKMGYTNHLIKDK